MKNLNVFAAAVFVVALLVFASITQALEWKDLGFGQYGRSFEDAQKVAKEAGEGWRLPTANEITHLIEDLLSRGELGLLDQEHPYWSAQPANPHWESFVVFCFGTEGECGSTYMRRAKGVVGFAENDAAAVLLVREKPQQ